MEATLSARGAVRRSQAACWSLQGRGVGVAIDPGARTSDTGGTALLTCVLEVGGDQIAVRNGTITLTVPNGDRLRGEFAGRASAPDPTGFMDLSGEFTVTGGTGRFAGAAGEGSVTGTVNTIRRTFFAAGQVRITFPAPELGI
jgi:hypothetical protein